MNPMQKEVLRTKLAELLFVLAAFIDIVTKGWAKSLEEPLVLFSGYASLVFQTTVNPYFAFSIEAPRMLILAVSLVVFFAVFALWIRQILRKDPAVIWLALILGGGAGNISDRIYGHGVVDWIEFSVGTFHWSSFNLADIFIFAGALGWVWQSTQRKQN